MITLEQLKNEYAIGIGYKDWYDLYASCAFKINEFEKHTDKVCKIAQIECLKLASKNAWNGYVVTGMQEVADDVKESITNENNLIK